MLGQPVVDALLSRSLPVPFHSNDRTWLCWLLAPSHLLSPPPPVARFARSGFSCFVVFWLPPYVSGVRRGQSPSVFKRYHTSPLRLVVVVAAMTCVTFTGAYTWYLSLTRTTVASNNSIYQVGGLPCRTLVRASGASQRPFLCLSSSRALCANAHGALCYCVVLPPTTGVQSSAALVYLLSIVLLKEKVGKLFPALLSHPARSLVSLPAWGCMLSWIRHLVSLQGAHGVVARPWPSVSARPRG